MLQTRAWKPSAMTSRIRHAIHCPLSCTGSRRRCGTAQRWSRVSWRIHTQQQQTFRNPLDSGSSSLTTRLFGSKPNSGGPPGKILIVNEQDALTIDLDRLRATLDAIRRLIGTTTTTTTTTTPSSAIGSNATSHGDDTTIGRTNDMYQTYDVSLFLIDDSEMRETNLESRGVDAPTDILSFPFHEAIRPGVLQTPKFDIPDYYNLGDLLVDVPYVIRSCQKDQRENAERLAQDASSTISNDEEEDEEIDDRGVSGAMATVYDPEKRVHMLLVHGMLHLVGYDHEDEDEFEQMVTKEEEILKALQMME